MAMAGKIPNSTDIISCPYNRSHRIEHCKMQVHLDKCRKQHPESLKTMCCPFDTTHVISQLELDFHISVCPKRFMFDSQRYQICEGAEFMPSATQAPPVEADEDWDDDCYTSYQPDPAKKSDRVIQKIRGAAPAERRKARTEGIKNYKHDVK